MFNIIFAGGIKSPYQVVHQILFWIAQYRSSEDHLHRDVMVDPNSLMHNAQKELVCQRLEKSKSLFKQLNTAD